jgi:predicted NUDIX family phosphoesterase
MAKLALCMKASKAHQSIQNIREAKESHLFIDQTVLDNVLSQTDLTMEDREDNGDNLGCEKNPAFLQLIPYVLAINQLHQVFSYSRGGSGEEARLHGKMSVGLGGHVDSPVPEGWTLKMHLQAEAARELQEEVGLVVDPSEIQIKGVLVNATTPVDVVHIGLLCVYRMQGDKTVDQAGHEVGVIDKGRFLSREALKENGEYDRMENWSKMALEGHNELGW